MPARVAHNDTGDDRGSQENDADCSPDIPYPCRTSLRWEASDVDAEARLGQQPRQRATALFAEPRPRAILVQAASTDHHGIPTAGLELIPSQALQVSQESGPIKA